ncbi:MAG: trigger factor [Sphingomonadaceae bacterium]|nr:trigger factor [Sphingomonadaceae bacterium]
MQIAEIANEGLRRQYRLTIPAAEIEAKIEGQLAEIAGQVRMPGFRPGKVPPNLIKKMHGAALRKDAVEAAATDALNQLYSERNERPAIQPQLTVDPQAGADVAFTVAYEVLPQVEPNAVEGIALERLTINATDADVDAALQRLADQQQRYEPAAPDHAAAPGDVVVADFEGSIDGELFEGGKGEGVAITLGSRQLIPGFEEQLVGVKANEQRTVRVTFPENYGAKYLAGREAVFEVTVAEVRTAMAPAVDEDFAKGLGLDSLEALREILKDQVEAEYKSLERIYVKRRLLDHLAATHDFAVPEGMVEAEFRAIMMQLGDEASRDSDPEAARASLDADAADYRRIAERRVRLGLLLSEIGRRAGIEVSQAEMNRLIAQEASRHPQKEQQRVIAFFRENATAAAQLRAPLYEDKVVDYLIGKAVVTETPSTREAIEAALQSEEGALGGAALPGGEGAGDEPVHIHGPDCDHDHAHAHGDDHAHGEAGAARGAEAQVADDGAAKPKRARKAKAGAVGGGTSDAGEGATAEADSEPAARDSEPASAGGEAAVGGAPAEATGEATAESAAKAPKRKRASAATAEGGEA